MAGNRVQMTDANQTATLYTYDAAGNRKQATEYFRQPGGDSTTPPVAPSNLAAEQRGYQAIALTWQDQAEDESGFHLERSSDGQNWLEIADLEADTSRYVDEGLARHTDYWYRLSAWNEYGESDPVNLATGTGFDPLTYEASGGTVTPNSAPIVDRTLIYAYDPLGRLTDAGYSDGRSFGYEYDAVSDVLTYTKAIEGQTTLTNYTYDDAHELLTSQENGQGTTWHYTYDARGSLVEITPGEQPASGAKRYSYNTAGYLVEVESHDGSGYQPQAEMVYNGLGQRLTMTGYAEGLGTTTRYLLDTLRNARPVLAEADGQVTSYVYGLNLIGEAKEGWSFYLYDGLNSVRQVSDPQGAIRLASSFTPWGDLLELSGEGDFGYGYLGGVLDAATGLIYLGDGQYYDPSSGRFLSRDTLPNRANPYVPWNGDPLGSMMGPLALLILLRLRKRKKNGEIDRVLLAALLLLAIGMAGMSLAACTAPTQPPSTTPPPTLPPPGVTTIHQPTSTPGNPPATPPAPTESPSAPVECTPTTVENLIYLGEWKITHYHYAIENDTQFPITNKEGESDYVPVSGLDQPKKYRRQFIYSQAGIYGQGTGISESGEYITIDHWTNLIEYGEGWEDNINPALWYFTYGKGGKFREGTPWASVAISKNESQLTGNDNVRIALYPGKTFEVTDIGTFEDTSHLDVFIGPDSHANALKYGTKFNVPVWKVMGE